MTIKKPGMSKEQINRYADTMTRALKVPQVPRLWVHFFLIFTAIEFIAAFSWAGFIHVQPVSITTLHVPVLLGAVLLGKWMGAALGGVFGLLSMWNASYQVFTDIDAVFSPLISGDPLGSIVVSVGTRIVFGFCAGWFFELAKHYEPQWLFVAFVSVAATFVHSVLVLGAIQYFFPWTGITAFHSLVLIGELNGVISLGLSILLVPAFYAFLHSTQVGQDFSYMVTRIGYTLSFGGYLGHLAVFFGVITVIVFSLVLHLIGRIQLLFERASYDLNEPFMASVSEVGMQFAAGLMAVIFILSLIFVYLQTNSFQAMTMAQRDSLTKVLNREALTNQVNGLISSAKYKGRGLFILVDVDYFKAVNDAFGHPFGDVILRRLAATLQDSLSRQDVIGRMGGDEFCLFLPGFGDEEAEQERVQRLFMAKERISLPDGQRLSWSFGISRCSPEHDFDRLYREADDALYVSKHLGRGQYNYYGRINE